MSANVFRWQLSWVAGAVLRITLGCLGNFNVVAVDPVVAYFQCSDVCPLALSKFKLGKKFAGIIVDA